MAELIVPCDLQMERESRQDFFFAYLISSPMRHDRRQADNPFPSIPAAVDQKLLRRPPRSPDLTACHFFSYADMLRTLSFYRLYHRICLSCEDESSLPSHKSIVTCFSGYGRKWVIGLTSVLSQTADTQSTCEVTK